MPINNEFNQQIEKVLQMASLGKNPNQALQMLYNRNPNAMQLNNQMNNLLQGRSIGQFFEQFARENGVSEANIQSVMRLLRMR